MRVSLGEVVDIRGGGTPSKKVPEYWGGSIPWASVKDFKSTVLETTEDSITELGVEKSATNLIPAGSIVVPTRMAVGKVAMLAVDMAINQDLKALLIKDEKALDKRYFLRFMESQSNNILKHAKGATVKGITLDVLRELEIPLPPLAEQKRIAAILDKADSIRRKRQHAIQLADEFLRAVFLDMFGDPVTNPKGWEVKSVADLIDDGAIVQVQDGNHGNDHPKVRDFSAGGIPFITANVVRGGKILFDKCYYLDESWLNKLRIGFAKPRDVLISHKGSLGFTAVLDDTYENYIFSPQTTYYRLNEEKIIPEYLKGYFDSGFFQHLFSKEGVQSTRAYLGITRQRELPIMIPTLEAQIQYADILAKYDGISKKATETEPLSDLFSSISQKAFSGQL
ncbi:MAG: restriction endonuclease subunit S [Gammaproteobacteria bacterium]|nr:MAG: restriction endonuclease subunit S [Gammaproteobacteria bacterium]